jgi:parallel beta-helix repeat (two copies)
LSYCTGNNVSGNEASNSGRGIHLSTSQNNIVSRNIIALNSISGIFMSSTSNGNIVFDNYLNNVFNSDVKDGSEGNLWNTTKTAGTNIVGGPFIGGNFWAKPDGTGFSQTATDADGDGIADVAYKLLGNNYSDFLPLVGGHEPKQSVVPQVNFNTTSTGASVTNETVVNNAETNKTEVNKMENQTEVSKTENQTEVNTSETNETESVDDSEKETDIDKTEDAE